MTPLSVCVFYALRIFFLNLMQRARSEVETRECKTIVDPLFNISLGVTILSQTRPQNKPEIRPQNKPDTHLPLKVQNKPDTF